MGRYPSLRARNGHRIARALSRKQAHFANARRQALRRFLARSGCSE